MSHIYNKRENTKMQIIKLATHLFVTEGYSKTTFGKMSKTLDISPGNITFYFPTKDHLLSVLVDELFEFQTKMMDHAAEEGQTSLLAYCLELTAIAVACEDSHVAKDFYVSAYTSPMTLNRIRLNDVPKTKAVFGEFCPDWTEEQWVETENIVSGIEYAVIMTSERETPLSVQISHTLNAIMQLYNVPKDLRVRKIEKVLNMDYRAIGNRILREFRTYIETRYEVAHSDILTEE